MPGTFGAVVRSARAQRGLTLREVARRLGISPAYLSDIERDRRNPPSGALRRALVDLLDVPDDDYLRYLEGHFPADLLDKTAAPEVVGRAFDAFRAVLADGQGRMALREHYGLPAALPCPVCGKRWDLATWEPGQLTCLACRSRDEVERYARERRPRGRPGKGA